MIFNWIFALRNANGIKEGKEYVFLSPCLAFCVFTLGLVLSKMHIHKNSYTHFKYGEAENSNFSCDLL